MNDLPIEVDVATTQSKLRSGEVVLLDVREPVEYETARIEGSRLLPMSEIQDRIGELAELKDKPIIVHCHHGSRSMQVTQWMRGQGFAKVQNMAGGIQAWSEQIDPAVPVY